MPQSTKANDEQMLKDIDQWSYDKLGQWHEDSIMRYKLIKRPPQEAFIRSALVMTICLARLIATRTNIVPEQAGIMLAKTIHEILRHEQEKQARKGGSGK